MSGDSPCKPTCEQVMDIIPEPFVIVDRNYRIIAANQHYRNLYGREDEGELVGRHCYEVSHHSSQPCSRHGETCPLETVFDTGLSTQVMHVHLDRQDREEYVQINAAPLTDGDGRVLYMGEQLSHLNGKYKGDKLLVGRSQPLLHMISLLHRVAPTQTTVLLLGESGTGKECVAEYLHHFSTRSTGPFVLVDCGTLGENLIESELFGHERGSFTGATARKIGLFEAAQGGTLFIDEIGEMPLGLQTKLLRVLETGTIRRIGGTDYRKVDVRIIAATNRNLRDMVEQGAFREDLYYRLSAFPIQIPPLRERKDDIPALAEHFLLRTVEDGERHLPLSPEVIKALLEYDYPGNVRELRNVVERAAILACDDPLGADHLVFERPREPRSGAEPAQEMAVNQEITVNRLLQRRRGRLNEEEVVAVLHRYGGHRGNAARELGVSERTLYRYIQRLRAEA